MILISVYIHDDRYRALTWRTEYIYAEDATSFARSLMTSSPHYKRVELRIEDDLIAWADRSDLAAAA